MLQATAATHPKNTFTTRCKTPAEEQKCDSQHHTSAHYLYKVCMNIFTVLQKPNPPSDELTIQSWTVTAPQNSMLAQALTLVLLLERSH